NGFSTTARTETGTDGTFLGGVSLRGGGENYDVSLSGAFRRTDGFNISNFGSEKDGDRNTTLNGTFTLDLSPVFTVDGTLRYVNRRSETDPEGWPSGLAEDGNDETATREFLGSVGATYVALDGALTQKARFTASDTFRENFGSYSSTTDGTRNNATYQATYEFDTPG